MNSEMANERVVYGTQELKMRRSNVRNLKGIRMSKGAKRRGGVFSSYRCRDYDSVVIRRSVKSELRVRACSRVCRCKMINDMLTMNAAPIVSKRVQAAWDVLNITRELLEVQPPTNELRQGGLM